MNTEIDHMYRKSPPGTRDSKSRRSFFLGSALRRALLTVVLAVVAGAIMAGCSSAGASGDKELLIGYKDWDENVAVANLTKVLLEEDLGYDKVELKMVSVSEAFEGVAEGDLDAFQDVWLPNLDEQLEEVAADVEHLDPWFKGQTAYGIAVPTYMNVRSLAELDEVRTGMIIGIGSDAKLHRRIVKNVVPEYDLDIKLVQSSTPAMLTELDRAYKEREPIVFLGWSPHWMNEKYDFRYLKDPKDAQGRYNNPSKLSTIVHNDLKEDDPVAYELIKSISLTEDQVNDLEAEINDAGDPRRGVKSWLADNRSVVEPWIEAAETTQES